MKKVKVWRTNRLTDRPTDRQTEGQSGVKGRVHATKNVKQGKSHASALSEKSGRETDEQAKTLKTTFELTIYLQKILVKY